jgi:hypothetical protein
MSFKVQVGPPQIAIHQGQTVLVTEQDGRITWPSEKGLYFLDTRIISNWAIYANGEEWELLNGRPINYYAARIFLTNKSILTADGQFRPARSASPSVDQSAAACTKISIYPTIA